MTIGDIAARFGLATHVLRHWESLGLLTPTRNAAGRRRYSTDHLYRVAAIMRAKEAGCSLQDIHDMIGTSDPQARHAILARHRVELAQRIARAQAALDLIDDALSCDHDDLTSCPHFQAAIGARAGIDTPSAISSKAALLEKPVGRR